MVVDDEDGKRPRGRNPWRGMCLRIDALDRIGRDRVELTSVDHHYPVRAEFGEIPFGEIRRIVQGEVSKGIAASKSFPAIRQKAKSGGTPL